MKTKNFLKIAGTILLGIVLTLNVQASNDKYARNSKVTFRQLTHTVRLTGEDIRNIQLLLSQSDAVHISWNNHELKFELSDGEVAEYTIRFEASYSEPVENWMFDSDYLAEETAVPVEDWMLETGYLSSENQHLEDWMFSETHLGSPESDNTVEGWMLDAQYLSR